MPHSDQAREHALRLLDRYEGDVRVVSEILGISKRSIYRWWQKAHPEENPVISEPTNDESFAEDLGNIINDLRHFLQQAVKNLPNIDYNQTSSQLLAITRVIDRLPSLVSMHEEYVRTVQRQEGTYEPVKFDVTLRSNKHWSVNIITLQDVSQENWYDFRKLFYSLEQAALVWYKRYGFYPVEYDGRTYPPDYVPPKPWDADLTPKERQEREYYQTYHVKRELTD